MGQHRVRPGGPQGLARFRLLRHRCLHRRGRSVEPVVRAVGPAHQGLPHTLHLRRSPSASGPADAAGAHQPGQTKQQGGPGLGRAGREGQDRPDTAYESEALPDADRRTTTPSCGSTTSACSRRTRPNRNSRCRCRWRRIAFKFGSAGEKLPGFTTVAPGSKMLSGKGVAHAGAGWPDALSGTFVMAAEGEKLTFTAPVPAGALFGLPHCRADLPPLADEPNFSPDAQRQGHRRSNADAGGVLLREAPVSAFWEWTMTATPRNLWPDYIARMYPVAPAGRRGDGWHSCGGGRQSFRLGAGPRPRAEGNGLRNGDRPHAP